jgi:hypothetical protein
MIQNMIVVPTGELTDLIEINCHKKPPFGGDGHTTIQLHIHGLFIFLEITIEKSSEIYLNALTFISHQAGNTKGLCRPTPMIS